MFCHQILYINLDLTTLHFLLKLFTMFRILSGIFPFQFTSFYEQRESRFLSEVGSEGERSVEKHIMMRIRVASISVLHEKRKPKMEALIFEPQPASPQEVDFSSKLKQWSGKCHKTTMILTLERGKKSTQ